MRATNVGYNKQTKNDLELLYAILHYSFLLSISQQIILYLHFIHLSSLLFFSVYLQTLSKIKHTTENRQANPKKKKKKIQKEKTPKWKQNKQNRQKNDILR